MGVWPKNTDRFPAFQRLTYVSPCCVLVLLHSLRETHAIRQWELANSMGVNSVLVFWFIAFRLCLICGQRRCRCTHAWQTIRCVCVCVCIRKSQREKFRTSFIGYYRISATKFTIENQTDAVVIDNNLLSHSRNNRSHNFMTEIEITIA